MDNNELANNYFTQLAYVSNENLKNTLHSATVDTEGKRSGCRNILSDDNESKRRGGGVRTMTGERRVGSIHHIDAICLFISSSKSSGLVLAQ